MISQYSILFAQIRPEIQERISIGFLLIGKGKVFFNFSKNKLDSAKGLMNESVFRMLKDSLRNIEKTAIDENKKAGVTGNQMPISSMFVNNTFTEEYLFYLSKYNNNILSFSKPKSIEVVANDETFSILFRKFIDESSFVVEPILKTNVFDNYKSVNRPRLSNHFNIDKEVTSDNIQYLLAPVKLDLIGQNEIPVYAQGVDLDRQVYHIEADLAQLLLIDKAYDTQQITTKGFIISREPSKKGIKQHNIWLQLRSNKIYEYVDFSEFEKIISYATLHGVRPIIAEIEN